MLVVNFFTKQAILLHLNAEYMGLQTVCSNFCDMLTMAFMAAGMVMLFQLYKPLETDDKEKTTEVFAHFRRVFRSLTAISLIAGCILSALTVYCVNMQISDWMVVFYFWLFLAGVLVYNRYLNNYFLLMADQKRYIASGICGIVDVASLVLEIMALLLTKRYGLFLCVIIFKNMVECGAIAIYRKRKYGFLSQKKVPRLGKDERVGIRKNILDMVITKIGSLLLYNTDSVITSAMVSTAVSGYYSCYYFISYGLQYTMTTVFDTLTPKFGRFSVKGSKDAQYRNYVLVSLANIFCTTLCVSGFYLLARDFLILWVGESVLLDSKLYTIISINLYISLSRYTSTAFRQAEGQFQKISWIILFRGVFNIFLSIAMGWKFGLLGIVGATAISDVLTVFWYEPHMVLRFYNRSMTFEYVYQFLGLASAVSTIFLISKVLSPITVVSLGYFALKVIIVVAGTVLWNAVIGGLLYAIYRLGKEKIRRILELREETAEEAPPPQTEAAKPIKLSFVIPVYNGAAYIQDSVRSVLKETETELEVLIINDGSTDNTLQLVSSIAETDPRVKVISTENQGQSSARNVGIRMATGDFITFADADDTVLWSGIHAMAAIAGEQKWDVVCGNYLQISDNDRCLGLTGIPSGEVVHDLKKGSIYQKIKTRSAFGYCWNKLYRTSFLRDNELLFDNARKVFMEDSLFNHKVFAREPRAYYCDVPVYEYYTRHYSTSKKQEEGIAQMYSNLLEDYSTFLKKDGQYEENLDLLVPLMMRIFCWALAREVSLFGELNKENLYERIEIFLRGKCFHEIVSDMKNIRALKAVPSFPQRVVYRVCFIMLNRGHEKTIQRLFVVGYPMIKVYLKYKQVK